MQPTGETTPATDATADPHRDPTFLRVPVPTRPIRALAIGFLLLITFMPLAQVALECRRGERVGVLDYFGSMGRELEPRLRRFEKEMHDRSLVTTHVLPWYQWALTRFLHRGNEQAVTGRDGWLFFDEDVELAVGPGVMKPGEGGRAALAAICDFRDQLQARGISLLLAPICGKDIFESHRLQPFNARRQRVSNADLEAFFSELAAHKIECVRADLLFSDPPDLQADSAEAGDASWYLVRDTHWTSAGMQRAAAAIAQRALELLGERPPATPTFATEEVATEGGGDLVRLLGLPPAQRLYPPMPLQLTQVLDPSTRQPIAPDAAAQIVLLGDSFTRVFSDPQLGLGTGAGLAEHLALRLGQTLDVIALAGGSATAVRAALAQRTDGLRGKRLVIWQTSLRLLSAGDAEWGKVELPPAAEPHTLEGGPLELVGEITEVSRIPEEFEYEFCLLVYEFKVIRVISGAPPAGPIWVAYPAIVDGEDTPARSLTVGMKRRLVLEDVRRHYNLEQASFIDNTGMGRTLYFPVESEEADKP